MLEYGPRRKTPSCGVLEAQFLGHSTIIEAKENLGRPCSLSVFDAVREEMLMLL